MELYVGETDSIYNRLIRHRQEAHKSVNRRRPQRRRRKRRTLEGAFDEDDEGSVEIQGEIEE